MVKDTKKVGDISFEDLGGRKVGDPVLVRAREPISLTDFGGTSILPYTARPAVEPVESKEGKKSEG